METVEALKIKATSASKLKENKEKEVSRIRDLERTLSEGIADTTQEIEYLKQQLEEIKEQQSQARQQIFMIEICKTSERSKIEAQVNSLNNHKCGFDELYDKVKASSEIYHKALEEKEAEQNEIKIQRQLQWEQMNAQQLEEAIAVEIECDTLEQECAVLKKRNAAIKLKLRRKLIETEDTRRELLRKYGGAASTSNDNDSK